MLDKRLVKYFNEKRRDKFWKKNSHDYRIDFRIQLNSLKTNLNDPKVPLKNIKKSIYRLGIGYSGIGTQNGLSSGIRSEKTLKSKSVTTNDHLIGAKQIGEFIHKEFEKHNFDVDYMEEVWLYDYLWLWMTIKVTSEEHHKDNILRDETSIEEKLDLLHYINVSELIYG
jgi:hypothetical protein